MNGCNYLVTGGAGFVGTNLVRRLLDENSDNCIVVVDNFWKWPKKDDRIFDDPRVRTHCIDLTSGSIELVQILQSVDVVFHLADVVGGINYVFGNQFDVMSRNACIDANVFRAIAEAGTKKLIYVGTACSYPQNRQSKSSCDFVFKEDDVLPADPESGYGWSKLYGELMALKLPDLGVDVRVARFHNVYGPYACIDERYSQVIPSLCKKILFADIDSRIAVWGSGDQSRSFLYVADAVDGLVKLAGHENGKLGVIQFGDPVPTPIRYIAEKLIKISCKNLEIEWSSPELEGDFCRIPDVDKASVLLAWQQKVDIDNGLRLTYDFYKAEFALGY